jgi:hypothetical protein
VLGVDVLVADVLGGIFLERTRRDEDAYYAYWLRYYAALGHDIEIGGGARARARIGAFDGDAALSWARRRNRSFLTLDGFGDRSREETNWRLQLGVRWQPPGAAPPR